MKACVVCGRENRVQIFSSKAYCSDLCRKVYQGLITASEAEEDRSHAIRREFATQKKGEPKPKRDTKNF